MQAPISPHDKAGPPQQDASDTASQQILGAELDKRTQEVCQLKQSVNEVTVRWEECQRQVSEGQARLAQQTEAIDKERKTVVNALQAIGLGLLGPGVRLGHPTRSPCMPYLVSPSPTIAT